jgi:triacylglycerol esterase/lipase EstA (alpha/beta hydrolase family)
VRVLQFVRSLLFVLLIANLGQAQASSRYIDRDEKRRSVIVFVHGVLGSAEETWRNDKSRAYWPEIVRRDSKVFSDANVWVFSYSSTKLSAAQTVNELATKLWDEMNAQSVLQDHDEAIFVVHSMGGLIVRQMLAKRLPPPKKIPLIYFFGTPSAGADIAALAALVSQNPQFESMKPFAPGSDVDELAAAWQSTSSIPNARYPRTILSYCAYEVEPVALGKHVVSKLSASFLCNTEVRASQANHLTMVKPKDAADEPHIYLSSAYIEAKSELAKLLLAPQTQFLAVAPNFQFRPELLEIRDAMFSVGRVPLNCADVSSGVLSASLALKGSERVVALAATTQVSGVQVSRQLVASLSSPDTATVEFSFDPTVAAAPIPRPCPANANATFRLRYVVEKDEQTKKIFEPYHQKR